MNKVEIKTIACGTDSAIDSQCLRYVTTLEQWHALWMEHNANQFPVPPMPVVDFKQKAVIAAFIGQRSRGGFSCTVESVEVSGEVIDVTVAENVDVENCTPAMTQPYHMVVFDLAKANAVSGNFVEA